MSNHNRRYGDLGHLDKAVKKARVNEIIKELKLLDHIQTAESQILMRDTLILLLQQID